MDADWLNSVPLDPTLPKEALEKIYFSALLVGASTTSLRFLVQSLLLELPTEDVVEMQPVESIAMDARPKFGIWVHVTMLKGSRLLALEHAVATGVPAAAGQMPFAIATRTEQPVFVQNRYHIDKTRRYLRRHGLAEFG